MAMDDHYRSEQRRPVEMPVRFRAGEALLRRGHTVDLGIHGAFIACEYPPEKGAELELELRSPTAWDPLRIACEVRWVSQRPSGFGVHFENLSATQASALYDFLQSLDYGDDEAPERPSARPEGEETSSK